MERIIGYSTKKVFRINCYVKDADGKCICDFQINGDGTENEMTRLRNTLLDNGFSVSNIEHADQTVPIIERC